MGARNEGTSLDQQNRLTAVLADGTRYRIYRSIVERPGAAVTVAEVAAAFELHPNVARMHLNKLEQAGLLLTSLRKGGSGGRPARLYRLSDKVSSLIMPPRRYDLLSDLALKALAETGDLDRVAAVCRESGTAAAQVYVSAHPDCDRLGRDELVAAILEVGDEVGMLPEVSWEQATLAVDVRNCVFKELSSAQPELVCVMHRAFLEGFIERLAGAGSDAAITAASAISRGDDRCRLRILFG
jgi:predicted ArsR family transcriptional regulator